MVRSGLIEVENTEFEKDGRVIPFRRISLTEAGAEVRPMTPLPLLVCDGIVEEFGGVTGKPAPERKKKPGRIAAAATPEPLELNEAAAALAERLKAWCATEAKRLRLPPYFILNDRTLKRVAAARPRNPKELLAVDGMGEAKVEKFGEAILELAGVRVCTSQVSE